MDALTLVQGSDDWRQARCGSLGASQVADALARTRAGWGASRDSLLVTLAVERLTGRPTESYVNAAMQWGTATEPFARQAYEAAHFCNVEEVGLVVHPTIAGTHASPDGLVGDDGLIEIKCPESKTHFATIRKGGGVPGRYRTQMQWQMACTGRAWCDYVSFDPRFPEHLQLHVMRVDRDAAAIAELEREVSAFLAEVSAEVASASERRAA